LEKFSKNILSQEANLKIICDVIQKQTGIILDQKNIKIQNGILYLQISPAEKSKIFMNKKAILERMTDFTPKILDIR
jgi:hypothetical protein